MTFDYRNPRRERVAHWKRWLCLFLGHDWGMFWNDQTLAYDDICVRCGKRK